MARFASSLVARFVLLVAAVGQVAAGSGCGGGGGGGSPPDPPTGFTARQSLLDFDQVDFLWTPPPGPVDGYEGEGRLGSGPWESLGDPIPGDAIGGTIEFLAPVPPELTDFTFRLRSVRGSARSAWSEEARYRRTLRPPTGAAATVVAAGIQLTWQNTSLLATGLRVEALEGPAWQVLASLPPTATGHLDAWHLRADQLRSYKLTPTAGTTEGLALDLSSSGYPATPVSGLTATTEPGGVRLRWTNPPLDALGLVVHQGPLNTGFFDNPVSGLLPPGTAEFLHAAQPGLFTYEVELRFGVAGVGDRRTRVLGVANPVGTPALTAALVTLPGAVAAARDAQGRLALARGDDRVPPATGPQRVVFVGAGAPPDHDLGENHGWAAPAVLFDAGGRPHAMVVRPVAGQAALRSLVHAWHDGLAWQEEEVTRRPFDQVATVRFAADPAGGLHAAWSIAAGPEAGYARRGAGGWAVEDVSAAWPGAAGLRGLAVEPAGIPAMLAVEGASIRLLRRDPDLGWLAEPVPYPAANGSLQAVLEASPAGLGVLQDRAYPTADPAMFQLRVSLLERTAGGWGPEVVAWDLTPSQPIDGLGLRASPGGRWLAWMNRVQALQLRVREPAADWSAVATGLENASLVGAWFDGAGRIGALVRQPLLGEAFDGTATYVLYQER